MPLRNTKQAYGSVAKMFHWFMAFIIIGLLAVGLIMTDMPVSPDKFKIYGLHKSFGITVLTLAVLRISWKIMNDQPVLPDMLKAWEKFLAHVGHGLLYVLMFSMPLSGWAMSSAAGLPVSVFGLFTLPNLVMPDRALKVTFMEVHETLAWVLIVMIVLHVLAALLHHYHYKNNVLRRMLPFTKEE